MTTVRIRAICARDFCITWVWMYVVVLLKMFGGILQVTSFDANIAICIVVSSWL